MSVSPQHYVAVDLGAESGRVFVGAFDGKKIALHEVHRFPTGPVYVMDSMRWDILDFYAEIETGLAAVCGLYTSSPAAIGVDTWGVDFGLLDRDGELITYPYHYRDRRTAGVMEKVCNLISRREIFEMTGIQFMPVNTLYQLYAMAVSNSAKLERAETFLMIPDILNYWLTGQKVCEFTNATTTQLHDPRRGWSDWIFEKLGLPLRIMPKVVPPGTLLGPVLAGIRSRTGLSGARVVAPACHDTASAVVAVPSCGADWAYLSSGTWSLLGVEVKAPILSEGAFRNNFTNEGGAGSTFRFLKNISGLWLVQECRRAWAASGRDFSYSELTELASHAQPFVALIDPDDQVFLQPGEMPERIESYAAQKGHGLARDPGTIIRVILESLALKYRYVLKQIESISGREIRTIHIVGGGSENRLLNQFTADATKKLVLAGPVEATALGNILMQAAGCGEIGSLTEARALVHSSFDIATYEPASTAPWDDAYERFVRMVEAEEKKVI